MAINTGVYGLAIINKKTMGNRKNRKVKVDLEGGEGIGSKDDCNILYEFSKNNKISFKTKKKGGTGKIKQEWITIELNDNSKGNIHEQLHIYVIRMTILSMDGIFV